MPLNKEAIISVLSKIVLPNQSKSVINQGLVTNIQVFKDSVDLDFSVSNPTLQYKKMIEEKISTIFRKEISAEIHEVDLSNIPDEIKILSPYDQYPSLVDRELVLQNSRVKLEKQV